MKTDVVRILEEHGIQPSAQRVAVAEYVLHTTEHPSADRVWTGVQARERGLVDELGGFDQAVERARRLANLQPGVRLKTIDGSASGLGSLGRMFGAGVDAMQAAGQIAAISRDPEAQTLLRQVAQARAQARGQGAVLAPTAALH